MKTFIATSALAIGMALTGTAHADGPAIAAAPATTMESDPATGRTVQPIPDTASEPMTSTAPQPAEGPATTAASNSTKQVMAAVDTGFPKYDADGSGALSQAEFTRWLADLKAQELSAAGQTVDPAQAQQYATRAMRVADADGNEIVTRAELTRFLGG